MIRIITLGLLSLVIATNSAQAMTDKPNILAEQGTFFTAWPISTCRRSARSRAP